MSLRRIRNNYYIDIRIKGAKKRIRRTLGTSAKAEALELYKQEKDRILAEYHQKEIRFEDFITKYLDYARSSKPASAGQEERRLEKVKAYFKSQGIEYLSQITPLHIEQFRAHLMEKGWTIKLKEGEKVQGVGKATANRYMQLLRGLFYKAIDWELYKGGNPVRKVRFFREQPVIKPLSHAQVKKILVAAREIAKKPGSQLQRILAELITFAINTGLRKSEILNLTRANVRDSEISVLGKGDKVRTVPLNAAALAIIKRQPKKDAYVFDIPNRQQQDLFRRTYAQITKKTGIDFHLHLLRHYFATTLVEKGVDFITISAILGHSKLTTSLIYSHTDKEKMRRAVEKISP